jgi:hypothetical protein
MSIGKFIDGIRFNYINFFAFWIFNCCIGLWFYIVMSDVHRDNPHVAEIRTACGSIVLIVIGYFFGASQNSKKKDDTIQEIITQQKDKDHTIKQMATTAESVAATAKTIADGAKGND